MRPATSPGRHIGLRPRWYLAVGIAVAAAVVWLPPVVGLVVGMPAALCAGMAMETVVHWLGRCRYGPVRPRER